MAPKKTATKQNANNAGDTEETKAAVGEAPPVVGNEKFYLAHATAQKGKVVIKLSKSENGKKADVPKGAVVFIDMKSTAEKNAILQYLKDDFDGVKEATEMHERLLEEYLQKPTLSAKGSLFQVNISKVTAPDNLMKPVVNVSDGTIDCYSFSQLMAVVHTLYHALKTPTHT